MTAITNEHWKILSSNERYVLSTQVADDVSHRLGRSITYCGLERSPILVEVAIFVFSGSRFALVSGRQLDIGFDADRYKPTPNHVRAFNRQKQALAGWDTVEEIVRGLTSRVRTVELPTLLVETRMKSIDASELSDGIRLPSWDEWEYLCAGGTKTLFWWGKDCPDRGTPATDLENPSATVLQKSLHGFALEIAQNPWTMEVLQDGRLRGGDGGGSDCGGWDGILAWISLSPWYDDGESSSFEADYCRRVIEIL